MPDWLWLGMVRHTETPPPASMHAGEAAQRWACMVASLAVRQQTQAVMRWLVIPCHLHDAGCNTVQGGLNLIDHVISVLHCSHKDYVGTHKCVVVWHPHIWIAFAVHIDLYLVHNLTISVGQVELRQSPGRNHDGSSREWRALSPKSVLPRPLLGLIFGLLDSLC